MRYHIHIQLVKVSKDTDGKEEGKNSGRRRRRKGQGWEKEEIGKHQDCQDIVSKINLVFGVLASVYM